MSPSHAHSASVTIPGSPNVSDLFGNVSSAAPEYATDGYSVPYQVPRVTTASPGGVRYYTPVGALQLPNGEIVPYEPEVIIPGVERLTLNPVPIRVLVPTTYQYVEGNGHSGGRGGGRSFHGGRGGRYGRHRNHRSEDFDSRGRGGHRPRGGPPPRSGSRRSRGVQKELKDNVKRTIYISDIDQQVTEEELANHFNDTGNVVDCRVCGDPNSAKRFAFIEFTDEDSAAKALEKSGCVMGSSAIRVLPSKTAIVPVNKDFMPKNMEEMELCSRTVYVANIDKKVDKHDVKRFFESLCGKVSKLRLLGDYAHSTRIAFVEFTQAESALAALNCSGAVLGTLPIRVSPSKAPVRMCSASDCED